MKISNLVNTVPSLKHLEEEVATIQNVVAPDQGPGQGQAPDQQPRQAPAQPVPHAQNQASPAASAVPSFITKASLVTVSGGTTAVTLLWQVAKLLLGSWAGSPWVAFGLSLLVGLVIYLLSVQDNQVRLTRSEKYIGFFIGFLNSMVLFSAAAGLSGIAARHSS